jgi:hypothetical protein
LKAEELHTEYVTVCLKPSERNLLVRLAEREQRSVSGAIRRLIWIGLREMGLDAAQAQGEREVER